MGLQIKIQSDTASKASVVVGTYTPIPNTLRLALPEGGKYSIVDYHQNFTSPKLEERKKRSYETIVTPEIDRILKAKDAFFVRADVCIVVAKHFPDIQMLIGAVNRLVSGQLSEAHLIIDRKLSGAFNQISIREGGTAEEKKIFDQKVSMGFLTFQTFSIDSEIENIDVVTL